MLDYLFTKTPLVFFTQNLWRDEAYSYLLAEKSIGKIIKLTVSDFSPPLYYVLLHFWMKVFGSSEVMLRSLSLLFFAGTIYVVFEIFQEVFKFSKIKSAIYMLIFLLNPFLLFYAFEARMYMMVTFFIALAYYAFWTKKKKLYILSMVCALYTHYFAAFILIAHFLETILLNYSFSLKFKPFKLHFLHKRNSFSIKPLIWSGLFFIPWVLFFISAREPSDGTFWIIEPPTKDILYVPFVLFTGYERVFGEYYHEKAGYTAFHTDLLKLLYLVIFLPLLIVLLQNVLKIKHKRHFHTLFKKKIADFFKNAYTFIQEHRILTSLFLWAFMTPYLLFFLSFVMQPYYLPRYFIFATVGFLLLLVYAFEHLISYRKSIIVKVFGIALFLFLLFMTDKFNTLNLKYRSKRTISRMAQEIKAMMNDTDYAYVTSELDYHLYQYYISEDRIKIYGKTYEEIPQYVGKVLIPPEAIAEQYPIYPERAFVIYYNWYTTKAIY